MKKTALSLLLLIPFLLISAELNFKQTEINSLIKTMELLEVPQDDLVIICDFCSVFKKQLDIFSEALIHLQQSSYLFNEISLNQSDDVRHTELLSSLKNEINSVFDLYISFRDNEKTRIALDARCEQELSESGKEFVEALRTAGKNILQNYASENGYLREYFEFLKNNLLDSGKSFENLAEHYERILEADISSHLFNSIEWHMVLTQEAIRICNSTISMHEHSLKIFAESLQEFSELMSECHKACHKSLE